MNGVQTRLKCKPNVKRCKRFVFAAHSPLLHPNTLKTKAIIHFQTDHILTRFVFPPLNHMGIVWDRGFFHQNDLQQCIADICTLQKKAVLNVVDAYRIMKTNGPRGRSASDVVLAKGLFISPDIVAVDTAAAKFFNQVREMPLDTVGHLAKGEALKIGTMNIDKLNVKRIKM